MDGDLLESTKVTSFFSCFSRCIGNTRCSAVSAYNYLFDDKNCFLKSSINSISEETVANHESLIIGNYSSVSKDFHSLTFIIGVFDKRLQNLDNSERSSNKQNLPIQSKSLSTGCKRVDGLFAAIK